ncbi:unnamed protein product, partial [Rotaria sordida]
YGAYLTNWLITQTTRFNATISGAGAGAVEHVAKWGTLDGSLVSTYLFGGYPWQVPSYGLFHLELVFGFAVKLNYVCLVSIDILSIRHIWLCLFGSVQSIENDRLEI